MLQKLEVINISFLKHQTKNSTISNSLNITMIYLMIEMKVQNYLWQSDGYVTTHRGVFKTLTNI